MKLLEECLLEITGMDSITLQPAAGAQGELTGLLLIRAYLEKRGNPRKKVLIPDSAHGTNPATAVIAGYQVENIKSESHGQIDVEKLRELVTDDVAALMITNPSTLGIFETAHRRNRRNSARSRRAALHGRRKHERLDGRYASRRHGRGCHAPQSSQNVLHAPWRWRTWRRAGGYEEIPRAFPPRAGAG